MSKTKREISKLESFFEKSRMGRWEWNIQTGEVVISEMWANIVGYKLDELMPLSIEKWKSFLCPQDLPAAKDLMERHFSGDLPFYIFLGRMRHKDGHWVWVLDKGSVISRDSKGVPLLMQGIHSDISELKKTEQAIIEKDRLSKKLSENIPGMMFQVKRDPAGKFSVPIVSEGIRHLFSCSPEDVADDFTPILKVVSEKDFQRVKREVENSAQNLTQLFLEFRVLIPGKGIRWVFSRSTPEKSEDGSISWYGFCADVSERREAEEALQKGIEKQLVMLANIGDVIAIIDKKGVIRYTSSNIEKLFGWKCQELANSNFMNIVHSDDFERIENIFSSIVRTKEGAKAVEFRYLCKDGEYKWISLTASNLTGDPVIGGILLNYHEITERKEAERKMQETFRELEKATELANRMAEQAETANRAKGEFLANMSHEIRTPLNGVIGMTDLLLETDLDSDQRCYAEMVRNSGDTLLSLLNDILDYSKIEAGKLDLENTDFNLRTLLDDFCPMLSLRIHEKGLELICFMEPDVPASYKGDPIRLRQILTNLVSNSLKFTEEGEISVTVSKVSETEKSVFLRISVKDTGIGIPEDKKTLLFSKFSQIDSSTTRKYGGTGLGLAISKQLAEMMGGEIGINSEEGKGSEFWFSVRLEKQEGPTQNIICEVASSFHLEGLYILVVDDNKTARQALVRQLGILSIRTKEASDGDSALVLLGENIEEENRFSAVIIDTRMPGMNGKELASKIKGDSRFSDIPLILMGPLADRSDENLVGKEHMVAFLTKPVRQNDLCDSLSIILFGDISYDEAIPAEQKFAAGKERLKEMKILVVEDNAVNRAVVMGILENRGIPADIVFTGKEAIEAVEKKRYDLVLMDLRMPVMDGCEATERIRKGESGELNRDIPIIAMTADVMPGDREKCFEAGMNDYLSKPINADELTDILLRWGQKETANEEERLGRKPEFSDGVFASFDYDDIVKRLMDDEVLAKKVLEVFVKDTPTELNLLKTALSKRERKSLEISGHSIKGAAENIGARRLRDVAYRIEQAAKEGNFNEVLLMIPNLELQFHNVTEDIKKKGVITAL